MEHVYFAETLDAAFGGAELVEVIKWEGHSPEILNNMLEISGQNYMKGQ